MAVSCFGSHESFRVAEPVIIYDRFKKNVNHVPSTFKTLKCMPLTRGRYYIHGYGKPSSLTIDKNQVCSMDFGKYGC